jgi:hypothetical protein
MQKDKKYNKAISSILVSNINECITDSNFAYIKEALDFCIAYNIKLDKVELLNHLKCSAEVRRQKLEELKISIPEEISEMEKIQEIIRNKF